MPLLNSLILNLSPAIAKALLKVWLKGNVAEIEMSTSVIDALKSVTGDALGRKTTERQLQAIADQVSVALDKIIATRGQGLTKKQHEAVANSIVVALSAVTIDATSLVAIDLAPETLTKTILDASPKEVSTFTAQEKNLYQIVAHELAQYVIDIASQFPQFSERIATDLLRRDTILLSVATRVLAEVEEIRKAGSADGADLAEFEIEYRRAVARSHDQMELFGVDLSTASKRHSLSVAYVSLAVLHKDFELIEDTSAVRVETALQRSKRWLIRGAPGAGKTTLINWLAVSAARSSFTQSLEQWNGILPFIIRLRQFAEAPLPAPPEFPKCGAPAIGSSMPTNWANSLLSQGRGLVLVDGIDEIPERRRPEVQSWLKDLAESYPRSIFIVTSRPHAIEDDWLAQARFAEAELLEMRRDDILTFIDHWHSAVAVELQDNEDKLQLPLLASSLRALISESRSIRYLAANPLLCAIICALHRDRHRQIPKDRVELYEACCSMLLERRDAERQIALGDYPRLTYRQKRLLLEDLAYWMLLNGQTQVVRSSADAHFQLRLESLRELPSDTTGVAVRRFFVERSGMLREPSLFYVDFTHRTFQEFLAARAALDAGDIGVLADHARDDQWRETIILAAGLSGKKARADLLTGLTDRIRKNDENSVRILLLTAQCINSALEIPINVRFYIEKKMSELTQPRTVREIKTFAAAGELGLPYLGFSSTKPEAVLDASVRELINIGTDAAMDVLEAYAKASATGRWPRVLNALTNGWETNVDREAFRERIVRLSVPEKNALVDLIPLTKWTYLEVLELALSQPTSMKGIEELALLREIKISGIPWILDGDWLQKCHPVSKMSICGPASDFDLTMLPTSLQELEIENCATLKHPEILSQLKLKTLLMSKCSALPPLDLLAGLPHLTTLRIRGGLVTPSDLAQLKLAPRLLQLELTGLDVTRPEISILPPSHGEMLNNDDSGNHLSVEMRELEERRLARERKKKLREASTIDIAWLAEVATLESLILDANDRVANFAWLKQLTKLKSLTLYNLGLIDNLDFLIPLKRIQTIYLYQVPKSIMVPKEIQSKVKEIKFVDPISE